MIIPADPFYTDLACACSLRFTEKAHMYALEITRQVDVDEDSDEYKTIIQTMRFEYYRIHQPTP
jgi:hypothetical protein